MQTISDALRNAIDAGNPQRILFVFSGGFELTNENIVITSGVELSEEFNSERNITIGLTPSSILTFTLLNDANQLSGFNFGWFHAYIGARIDSGTPTEITRTFTECGQTVTYAFAKIGTFYAQKPDVIKKTTVSVTAYDRMIKFDRDMPASSTLGISYPTTIGTILTKMCNYLSFTQESTTFLNSDLTVASEPKEFKTSTMRQVVSWIAECACSTARFNRAGNLELVWFSTASGALYDEHNYKGFDYAWYETTGINGLYCRDTTKATESQDGTTKTNNYLIQDNPFLMD